MSRIAVAAHVTPSTLYRRWGSLAELLADVAAERFHADPSEGGTGSLRGDLEVWLRHLVEDVSGGAGVPAEVAVARRALRHAKANLDALVARARDRGEASPPAERLMDLLAAPVVMRLVVAGTPVGEDEALALIDAALAATRAPG